MKDERPAKKKKTEESDSDDYRYGGISYYPIASFQADPWEFQREG